MSHATGHSYSLRQYLSKRRWQIFEQKEYTAWSLADHSLLFFFPLPLSICPPLASIAAYSSFYPLPFWQLLSTFACSFSSNEPSHDGFPQDLVLFSVFTFSLTFPYKPMVSISTYFSFSMCGTWFHTLCQEHGTGSVKIQIPWLCTSPSQSTQWVGPGNVPWELNKSSRLLSTPLKLEPLHLSRRAWLTLTMAAQHRHLVASWHHCLSFASAAHGCWETIKNPKKRKEIGTEDINGESDPGITKIEL